MWRKERKRKGLAKWSGRNSLFYVLTAEDKSAAQSVASVIATHFLKGEIK
jgi:hypothetical protein